MADALAHEIQLACDDLYCAPLDPVVQANVRDILLRLTPPANDRDIARRIRIGATSSTTTPQISMPAARCSRS